VTWTRVDSLEQSDLVSTTYEQVSETEAWPRYKFEMLRRPEGFRFMVFCQIREDSEWTVMGSWKLLDGHLGPVLEVLAWAYSKWGGVVGKATLPDNFQVERPEGSYPDGRLRDYVEYRVRADDLIGGYTVVGSVGHTRPFYPWWDEQVYRDAVDGDEALLSADEVQMRQQLARRGVTPDRITEMVILVCSRRGWPE